MRVEKSHTRIAVLGYGVIGRGIAACCMTHGYRVSVLVRDEAKAREVRRRSGEAEARPPGTSRQTGPRGYLKFGSEVARVVEGASAIIECVGEEIDAKAAILSEAREWTGEDVLFATTTSGLSVSQLASTSGCGDRLVGTHFWNPPQLMPLVEVVRGSGTSDRAIAVACNLVESIGKIPVEVKDVPGFIGNRLLHALWREAVYLVDCGIATPADIDLVARLTFGLRMAAIGPLENMDIVGLDLVERIHTYLLGDLAADTRPSGALTERVACGQFGIRTGHGFYEWSDESAQAIVDRRDRLIRHNLATSDGCRLGRLMLDKS